MAYHYKMQGLRDKAHLFLDGNMVLSLGAYNDYAVVKNAVLNLLTDSER